MFRHIIQYINDDFESYEVYIIGLMAFVLILFPFFLAVWTFVNTEKLGFATIYNKFGVFYESLRCPDPYTHAKVNPGGDDINSRESPHPTWDEEER